MSDQLQSLLHQFRTSDLQGQVEASIALAQSGVSAIDALIAIVQDEEEHHLWWLAAQALGQIGSQRAVEPLVALLNSPISHQAVLARKYTAYALAQLADVRAVDALIAMLHERDHEEETDGTVFDEPAYETIEAAAGALAKIGDPRGIQAVLDRILEGNFWIDGLIDFIDEWGGDTAFQYLVAILQTADVEQRRIAVSLLSELRDPRAFSVLADLFQRESDDDIRHSAMSGLGELRTTKAVPIFLQALADSDDEVQLSAAFGIRYLILGDFPVPEEPDKNERIKQIIHEVGETALITYLTHVTQTVRPSIATYSALFLEAFTPYVASELVEQHIKPALDALPKEVQVWVNVERRSLSAGL